MAKANAKSVSSEAKSKARKSASKLKTSKTVRKSKPKILATSKATRKMMRSKPVKSVKKKKAGKTVTESPRSVRLIFSYDGDKVKLISQQQVEMTVPPSDATKGFAQHKGFWAELKGQHDQTLYRHVMHNPTRNDAEVFSDDPEQSISRQPAPKRKGVFVVVVPDTDQGHEVTLSRSESQGPTGIHALAAAPAKEIARIKLKK